MGSKGGFFNAEAVGGGYAPTYNASDFSSFFSAFISNGVFPNATNSALQVTPGNGLSVNVNIGMAVINGRWLNNYSSSNVSLASADANYSRIDNIVVELNMANPSITLTAVTGTPSSSPTAPDLISNSTVTQLCLGTVLVPANANSVTSNNITDTRSNTQLCGWASASAGESTQLNAILRDLNKIYNIVSKGVPVFSTKQYPSSINPSIMGDLVNWNVTTGENGGLKIYATELILQSGQIQVITFPTAFNKYCYPVITPSGVQASDGCWELPSSTNTTPFGNTACIPGCSNSQIKVFNPWGLTGSFFLVVVGE